MRRAPAAVEPVALAARRALGLSVGLAVLAVQQFQADRPRLEQDLRDLGLPGLAAATNRAGGFIDDQVARLLRPPRPR